MQSIFVKGEDGWGKSDTMPSGSTLSVSGEGGAKIVNRNFSAIAPGVTYVEVNSGNMVCSSNPVQIDAGTSSLFTLLGWPHACTDR